MYLLLAIYCFCTLIQLLYWGIGGRPVRPKKEPPSATNEPVSVIICARNEAENLRRHLPHILAQAYAGDWEVWVVDDHSTDKTAEVVLSFQEKHPNLHLLQRSSSAGPGKKQALTEGIQSARYDRLVMIDADCQPNSTEWLSILANSLTDTTVLALGYGPYLATKGWLNRFLRFETLYIAIQYFSAAQWGYPYMGVGRNLAYRRTLFEQNNGFYNHQHIASGDDDLFISAVANHRNTTTVPDARAHTYSVPVSSWRAYYYQKTRHLSTSWSYRPLHQWLLAILAGSQVLHHLLLVVLCCGMVQPQLVLTLYLVRLLVVSVRLRQWMDILNSKISLIWLPFLDLWLTVVYGWLAPAMLTDKEVPWKP